MRLDGVSDAWARRGTLAPVCPGPEVLQEKSCQSSAPFTCGQAGESLCEPPQDLLSSGISQQRPSPAALGQCPHPHHHQLLYHPPSPAAGAPLVPCCCLIPLPSTCWAQGGALGPCQQEGLQIEQCPSGLWLPPARKRAALMELCPAPAWGYNVPNHQKPAVFPGATASHHSSSASGHSSGAPCWDRPFGSGTALAYLACGSGSGCQEMAMPRQAWLRARAESWRDRRDCGDQPASQEHPSPTSSHGTLLQGSRRHQPGPPW